MLGKELYRILSRRITLLALVAAAAFLFYYGHLQIWEESVIENGEVYLRDEAVSRDRIITEEFAGPLTEEAVRAIWEKYGAAVNQEYYITEESLSQLARQGGNDNYCNRLVTRLFTQRIAQEDGTFTYVLPDDLSESHYLDGSYSFGYAGKGWIWYWEQFLVIIVMVSIVITIAFSPVFSEDYALRTADIILSTAKGRLQIWLLRTGVGFLFASVCYWLICGIAFLQQYLYYGPEGLYVSCGLTQMPYYWMEDSAPLWKALLILHLGGWFSLLVLILQIQAISAKCKSSFVSLLWSLAVYLGPIFIVELVLNNLPFSELNNWLKKICYSMPLSFSGMYLQAPPSGKQVLLLFALIAAVLAGGVGAAGWCRHEVKN